MLREFILAGEKVALAEMVEEDQALFQRWLSENPELRELIDDLRIPTMEDQRNWFKRLQKPDRRFFSLLAVLEGVLIGNAGFVEIDPEKKSAMLRITIGHPEFHGKGFGSEAVALLVRYAFEIAAWRTLRLTVLKTNTRAVRTYEKVGFRIQSEHLHNGKEMLTMELFHPAVHT